MLLALHIRDVCCGAGSASTLNRPEKETMMSPPSFRITTTLFALRRWHCGRATPPRSGHSRRQWMPPPFRS